MALPPTYGDGGGYHVKDVDRGGKVFVHTREDSNNSLEEMFRVVKEPGINFGLPLKDRKLPRSFFQPPDNLASTLTSPTSSLDSLSNIGRLNNNSTSIQKRGSLTRNSGFHSSNASGQQEDMDYEESTERLHDSNSVNEKGRFKKAEPFLLQQFLNQSCQNQENIQNLSSCVHSNFPFQHGSIAHSRAHSSPACLPINTNAIIQHNKCQEYLQSANEPNEVKRPEYHAGNSNFKMQRSRNYSKLPSHGNGSISAGDSVPPVNNNYKFSANGHCSKLPMPKSFHSHQSTQFFGGFDAKVEVSCPDNVANNNYLSPMDSDQHQQVNVQAYIHPRQSSGPHLQQHSDVDKSTKMITFEVCPLPSGWEMGFNEECKIYYINHNKESTSWYDPRIPQDWQSGWGHTASEMSKLHLNYYNKIKSLNNLTAQKEILLQQLENTTRNEYIMRQEVLSMQSLTSPQLRAASEHRRQESSDSGLAPEPTFTPPLQEANGGSMVDPVACLDDLYPSLGDTEFGLTDVDMVHFREDFPSSFV